MTDHKPKTDWKDKLYLQLGLNRGDNCSAEEKGAKGRPEQAPGSRETASFTPEHMDSIHKHRVKGTEGNTCNVESQTHFKVGVLTVNNCHGGCMFSV